MPALTKTINSFN